MLAIIVPLFLYHQSFAEKEKENYVCQLAMKLAAPTFAACAVMLKLLLWDWCTQNRWNVDKSRGKHTLGRLTQSLNN